MELYKDYPRLCTIWCFFEILFYAGQLFGWSSILYVLKKEGFYSELCADINSKYSSINRTKIDIFYTNLTLLTNSEYSRNSEYNDLTGTGASSGRDLKNVEHIYYNENGTEYGTIHERDDETIPKACQEQDSRLNLWFSIAICVSYVMCSVMGPILQRLGMRGFRLLSLCTYVTGALCLGFATPETAWVVCPGLCCIGVAGMSLYSTNIHVSFLFPAVQSTITSVFVGLYDASTVVSYLMKVAFDAGIPRKYFYTGLSILHLLLIGTSTCLFLPCVRIRPRLTGNRREQSGKILTTNNEKEKFITKTNEESSSSLRTIFSCEYLLHVYWMCVQGLRFVSFLGFFNTWLEDKFNENRRKENYYLGVFSYVTMATIITAITAGMFHDCQRRKYMMSVDYKRRRLPIILPLTVTSLMSVVITSLTFVKMEIFLNIIFVLFTVYRSYLFSFEITFLNDIYPLTSFSVLFGVLHSSAGLSGMLQYPLFGWYQSYTDAPSHVNIFLICLAISSLAHPVYLWYKCRTHRCPGDNKLQGTEIHI